MRITKPLARKHKWNGGHRHHAGIPPVSEHLHHHHWDLTEEGKDASGYEKERQKVKKVKRKEGGEEFLKDEVLWDEKAMKKHSESESWGKIHVSQDTHIFL